ncbi:hypothetical protein [Pragia fontium]|nr:hypothetical protein [Pragia fontium]
MDNHRTAPVTHTARMRMDNTTVVTRYLGLSELIISLTIVAMGTSLPVLAAPITDMYKHENDIMLENIIAAAN